jgi:hypothetical protein
MSPCPIKHRYCANSDCALPGQVPQGNIVRQSFYRTTQGRRRRYRCTRCGRTFSPTAATPYYRLHKPRALFYEVARMSVDGLGKSAIACIKRIAWNTTAALLHKYVTLRCPAMVAHGQAGLHVPVPHS